MINYIPVRIASTGSSLAAEIAGMIPEINPIMAETKVPINMLKGDNTNSKSPVNWDAISATIQTKTVLQDLLSQPESLLRTGIVKE